MAIAELHAQACVWDHRGRRYAALFLEGEAPDHHDRDRTLADAAFQVARAGGLKLTTDLARFAFLPTPGWRAEIDSTDAVTVYWPHRHPLLARAPLNLPDGWLAAATEHAIVVLFVGSGFDLATKGVSHPTDRVRRIAESGALAAGAIRYAAEPAHEIPVQMDRAAEFDARRRLFSSAGARSRR